MPTLVVHQMGEQPRLATVDKPTVLLGRDPSCDVVLATRMVSRNHARIDDAGGGRFTVSGLKPNNPLVVNGEVVGSGTPLSEGDQIQIANFLVIFSTSPSARELYMKDVKTYEGRCDACGWTGQVGAMNTNPLCPRCNQPIAKRSDVIGKDEGGDSDLETFYLSEGGVKKMHGQVKAAKLARLVRLSDEFGLPKEHTLRDRQPCPLGKLNASPMPVSGFMIGAPAQVEWRADGWWVRKGGMLPKLKVNGAAVVEHKLGEGDLIQLGKTRLRFTLS